MLISPQEAKSRRFGLILDVRTQQERELYGAYPNSVNIPFEKLTNTSISDLVSKDTSILIYCKRGTRASQAAEMLTNWGFKNVKYINQTYSSMMPPGTS
jgi:rhodanese-related sulfurtransferase